jgi:hypothetical protein
VRYQDRPTCEHETLSRGDLERGMCYFRLMAYVLKLLPLTTAQIDTNYCNDNSLPPEKKISHPKYMRSTNIIQLGFFEVVHLHYVCGRRNK